jgi:hypothetical protein
MNGKGREAARNALIEPRKPSTLRPSYPKKTQNSPQEKAQTDPHKPSTLGPSNPENTRGKHATEL